MELHVRSGTRADVANIEAIARRCLPGADDRLELAEVFTAPEQVLRLHVLRVASDGDTVVGFAFLAPFIDLARNVVDMDTALLTHICVDEAYRGGGVATALERDATTQLAAIGYRRAVAKVTGDGAELLRRRGWTIKRKGQELSWLATPRDSSFQPAGPATRFHYGDPKRRTAVKVIAAE